ncbi:MAG: xanthine dehydrogenase small subunit [Pseudomonadota bacterium]
MNTQPLKFFRRGEVVSLPAVDTNRTLLEVLREDLHSCGTKEGCGEGDCGACTVVIAEADGAELKYSAINSCIRLAHSVDGMAVWTAEDLTSVAQHSGNLAAGPSQGEDGPLGGQRPAQAAERGGQHLHPVQQAMVDCHGSQCGFCTPGFVMSLFGQYQTKTCKGIAITREDALGALSGNLCRCTGYRPILDAAEAMQAMPLAQVDEAEVLSNLERMAHIPRGLEASSSYMLPRSLAELLAYRAAHPDAQLVAGCTDVGLWVTKMHMQFSKVLDVTQVAELRRVEHYPHHIAIGAAVTLTDAFDALIADRLQLAEFAHRFAGLPVRNSGTLGGNVANGSPIGDSMPLLIALGASVVLMRQSGKKQDHRELPLEDLYTGYRKNVMAADEVLAWIKVPKATAAETSRVYKISKRFEDDISAVCLAINVQIANGKVRSASIGAGGVAATPVRARKTEAALVGQAWTPATIQQAMQTLRAEFAPISDMRASAAYRSTVLGNLLQRFWLESQGTVETDLRSLDLEDAAQGEAA